MRVLTLEEATPPDFGQCHVVDYCARWAAGAAQLFCSWWNRQLSGRHAYCYTYIRWDWCYHFQNDHNSSNTESKNVHFLLCVESLPSGIESFLGNLPTSGVLCLVLTKKNIFYMKSIYSNSSLSSTSQFVRHPKDNSTESNNIHLNLMKQYSPLCLCMFMLFPHLHESKTHYWLVNARGMHMI